MIDPTKITNYNLDEFGLQEHLLFWVLVAGKNARYMAKALDRLLNKIGCYKDGNPINLPFNALKDLTFAETVLLLRHEGVGCFNIKAKAVYEVARCGLDLKTCTTDDLEKIFGVGLKTSRCFIIHSRRDAQYAGLDTHIRKYLTSLGYALPKNIVNNKKRYKEYEKIFIELAFKVGKPIAEFDLEIWNKYSKQQTKE